MIIYLYSDNNCLVFNLPVNVNGMYPIYINERLIVTVYAEEEKWHLCLSDDFLFTNNEENNCFLKPYDPYYLKSSMTGETFELIAIYKYDKDTILYNIFNIGNALSIGCTSDCDIYFPYLVNASLNSEQLQIIPSEDGKCYRTVKVNTNTFFVNGKRAYDGMRIYNGDYIFFHGLKVILLGSKVLVNNPNNLVSVSTVSLQACDPSPDYVVNTGDNSLINEQPLYSKNDYFYKSPRFNFIIEEAKVKIDEPPSAVVENDIPTILTVGPQLTMIATSSLSMISFVQSYLAGESSGLRFAISLGTLGTTIVGALLWPYFTRKFNKRRIASQEKKRQVQYLKYLEKKATEINSIKLEQKNIILNNYPSVENCLRIIENRSKELWQRNIDQEDFLTIRLGLGQTNTKIQINAPEEKFSVEEEDKLVKVLKKVVDDSLIISEVPVTYTFTKQNVNAIVGTPKQIKEFMDFIFLQMLTFHSYTDLKIIVFTKEPEKWEYLKVVPHCWDNQKSIRYFATNVEELSTIAGDIEKIFDARVSNSEEEKLEDNGIDKTEKKNFSDFRPYYLFFIDDMTSLRNVSLINKILNYKRNIGFSLVITSGGISSLPSETGDFICLGDNQSAIMSSQISNNQKFFLPDYNTDGKIDIYNYAQKLANIPIMVEKAKYDLPTSLSFLELYGVGRVEQLNSLARWSDNNPVLSLSVPIGIDQNGELFKMDIHEKASGPHGLIAGTTGSGKSEWIVTYILSLAVNFSPEEVQFVLIDYKGGGLAMSFENKELGVKLPHLAGTITNLDKSEIYRSIAAIESELKRRQTIFNEAREKLKEGSMNIYKYQQFYRKNMLDEPLSHLLIICDEFAELKQQQPEFMEQLISTSRIGRSLGIHLILATQKPSGVVNDQIWSNSKFKVCLKVQDKSDSNEILKKPDAAFLKQTGAFYLQVGNDDYYNLGQSAWAGAKYYPSDKVKKKIDESVEYIDNIGRTIDSFEEKEEKVGVSQGEELLNIVSYISNISKEKDFKNRLLWLDNIPEHIFLNDLIQKYHKDKPLNYTYNIAIGEYDEPRKQEQGLLQIDLSQGNVAIIGNAQSGIDNLLSTIIWSSITEHTPQEIAFYIFDFGAETLKKFAKFPHVGEVVFQDDVNKVGGVLDLILEEFDNRKELLSDYNGSFEYYNKVSPNKLPLIVVLINAFDVFTEVIPKLNDLITTLFRDTAKYGIIFIVSAGSPTAIRQRQLQYFNHTIVMQINDDSQYRSITNCRRGLIPKRAVGRGICKIDAMDNDSYCEFQTALITSEEKELELIKNYADSCVNYYKYKVKQLAKIPDNVTSDELTKYITTLSDVPIGYNFYEKDIAKYNFESEKIHLFTGKSIKDNIYFFYALASLLSKVPNVKVRVIDMMNIFTKPILDIKLFNEDIDVVFAALEKDVLTRTDAQDYAINLVFGIGQYKRKLSKGALEIFKNTFNNIAKSKKTIYILIDDYDKLRTLKLEEWFDTINVNKGLWLGEGVSNQSIFKTKEISNEDKKYNYEGLAFNLNDNDYKVIKTVMDGDE